jgi:hypothetical protein
MIRPNHPYAVFVETKTQPLTLLVHSKDRKEAVDFAKGLTDPVLKRVVVKYSPTPYEEYEKGKTIYSKTF